LEGRWGRLIAHAFRTGCLDFTRYRPGDPYWALAEAVALDDIEAEFRAQVSSLTMMWHACAGQPTGWEEDDKRTGWHEREARKVWNDVGMCLLPWYDQFGEEKAVEQLWKEFIERGKDPVYAAWLAKERQRLRDMAHDARKSETALVEARKGLKALAERGRRRRRR